MCIRDRVVTVIIQSSSASVGILQALSSTGLVTFGSAIPIILGAHIGTAFTPLLTIGGSSKDGKRAALIQDVYKRQVQVRGGVLAVIEDLEGSGQRRGGHAVGLAAHDHLGKANVVGGVQGLSLIHISTRSTPRTSPPGASGTSPWPMWLRRSV